MNHDYRMSKLEEMRNEQLSREYGHRDGKGHENDMHHSLHEMLGNRPMPGQMKEHDEHE